MVKSMVKINQFVGLWGTAVDLLYPVFTPTLSPDKSTDVGLYCKTLDIFSDNIQHHCLYSYEWMGCRKIASPPPQPSHL